MTNREKRKQAKQKGRDRRRAELRRAGTRRAAGLALGVVVPVEAGEAPPLCITCGEPAPGGFDARAPRGVAAKCYDDQCGLPWRPGMRGGRVHVIHRRCAPEAAGTIPCLIAPQEEPIERAREGEVEIGGNP